MAENIRAPVLAHVTRLDSIPLNQTYYTAEGYLVDRPIVTSTGIFEYTEADGSVRRELRLPEDVFDPESLKSYRGKPIIIMKLALSPKKMLVTRKSARSCLRGIGAEKMFEPRSSFMTPIR